MLRYIRDYLLLATIFCLSGSVLFAQENDDEQVLQLDDPVKYEAYYDYKSGNYILYPKLGGVVVGTPITMTAEDYTKYVMQQKFDEYYKERSRLQDEIGRAKKE